mgnify:CR=1 FL=1
MSKIGLATINDIKNFKFIVETYQRGYRWETKQVEDLLNDLNNFRISNEETYCLQPIIVKKIENNVYELIDGQQRLTTLKILLTYLKKDMYKIDYRTRAESQYYLDNIEENLGEQENKNIDFYFMKNAYNVINSWFSETKIKDNDEALEDEFRILLTGGKQRVKFIWYEIDDSNYSAEKIFTRINIGKINLTDAELIKAKLLYNANPNKNKEKYERQVEIGSEWDNIEKTLNNDDFWGFITDEKIKKANRIEYIFDYIVGKKDEIDYYTFEKINYILDNEMSYTDFWNNKVKKYFGIFKEWYNDIELYNYIGLLNLNGNRTYELINDYENEPEKDKFKEYIKAQLIEKIENCIGDIEQLDNLNYNDNYDELKFILILLNSYTLTKMNQRFPFGKFKIGEWSIEHIHAQNCEELKSDKKKWKIWCEDQIKTISELIKSLDKQKIEKYEQILNKLKYMRENIESILIDDLKKQFKIISDDIKDDYGVENIHTLGNLALLDKSFNSYLNNGFFDSKREKIIEEEKKGKFYIPICTKNVFLKFYSKTPDHIYFWNDIDRKQYKEEMKNLLKEFCNIGENEND